MGLDIFPYSANEEIEKLKQIRKEQYHSIVPNLQKIVIPHSFGDLAEQHERIKVR